MENDDDDDGAAPTTAAASAPAAAPAESHGATATALYDYEAGEDNELAFPENAIITNVVSIGPRSFDFVRGLTEPQTFPDEDWWQGEYDGRSGLFPSNYTKLND